MTDQPDELSIGQVAERSGLSVHALRFYEREGIFLSPIRRAAGGRRVYTEDDVDWLTLCTILRGAAMPLEDIRQYTELVRAGDGNEPERLVLLRQHEERVREQQQKLDRFRDLIRFKMGSTRTSSRATLRPRRIKLHYQPPLSIPTLLSK